MSKQQTARKTIGADPFDVQPLLDDEPPPRRPEKRLETAKRTQQPDQKAPKAKAPKRQKATVNIRVDLMERVKNAAYWEPGLTVTSIVEMGILHALRRLRARRADPTLGERMS